ncbi:winged helix-turn-helix domain-containing protein [bacterium]|nr:winged helix-turn-helix domain-containing protein [candidate division CSSED10-310 bacterium]
MDDFELALKGLSKYLMEMFQALVEKGKADAGLIVEKVPEAEPMEVDTPEEPKPLHRRSSDELTTIDKKILGALQGIDEGLTLRELAKKIDLTWQTIVRPMNLLVEEKFLVKHRKQYGLPGVLKSIDKRSPKRRRANKFGAARPKPVKMSDDQKDDLRDKVLELIDKSKNGLTLPEMGSLMDRNWQSLKDIVRELLMNDKIIKIPETKKYVIKA